MKLRRGFQIGIPKAEVENLVRPVNGLPPGTLLEHFPDPGRAGNVRRDLFGYRHHNSSFSINFYNTRFTLLVKLFSVGGICAVPFFAVLGGPAGRQRNAGTSSDDVPWQKNIGLWAGLPKKPKNWTYQPL
jgi:hypothetical protein